MTTGEIIDVLEQNGWIVTKAIIDDWLGNLFLLKKAGTGEISLTDKAFSFRGHINELPVLPIVKLDLACKIDDIKIAGDKLLIDFKFGHMEIAL